MATRMGLRVREVEQGVWRFYDDATEKGWYIAKQNNMFTLHDYTVRLNGITEENTYGEFNSIEEAVESVID